MADRASVEAEALAITREEVALAEPGLRARGFEVKGVKIQRDGSAGQDCTEIAVRAYRGAEFADMLEFHVWWKGAPVASASDLRAWLKRELPTLDDSSGWDSWVPPDTA